MASYLESYIKRVKEVDSVLKKIAQDLVKDGFRVLSGKSEPVKYLKIFKDNKHITLGFSEVPYSWYFSMDFVPSSERGSSSTLKTFGYDEFPNREEIISAMRDTPYGNTDKHISKLNYMKEILLDETIHEPQQ